MSIRLFLVIIGLFFGLEAWAQVSPECIDPIVADPAEPYNAIVEFKYCAPQIDVNGEALTEMELDSCSLVLDGVVFATVSGVRPGQFFSIASPNTGRKHRQAFAYCSGPAGDGPPTETYTAHVRHERPGRPDTK